MMPDYKIEIEGRTLDPETKGDVLDVKVTMEKENLTGFSQRSTTGMIASFDSNTATPTRSMSGIESTCSWATPGD